MIKYRDFVPQEIQAPGFLKPGQHETLDQAVAEVNRWLAESHVKLISIETVALPNIWSRWEEGSSDGELSTSGESLSRWHQFVRCWYHE